MDNYTIFTGCLWDHAHCIPHIVTILCVGVDVVDCRTSHCRVVSMPYQDHSDKEGELHTAQIS